MKFYSPLRYPGGKNCIFKFVSSLFHENDLVGCSYAEPYAGGCGLALRLLFEEYVEKIYINDLDVAIYAFWVSILERNDDFCTRSINASFLKRASILYLPFCSTPPMTPPFITPETFVRFKKKVAFANSNKSLLSFDS